MKIVGEKTKSFLADIQDRFENVFHQTEGMRWTPLKIEAKQRTRK